MRGLRDTSIDSKLNTIRFIKDLFEASKFSQLVTKEAFFTKLVNSELIKEFVEIMMYTESEIVTIRSDTESVVKDTVEYIVDSVERIHEKLTENEAAIDFNKLELLKANVVEVLTECFQILPSKVMSFD